MLNLCSITKNINQRNVNTIISLIFFFCKISTKITKCTLVHLWWSFWKLHLIILTSDKIHNHTMIARGSFLAQTTWKLNTTLYGYFSQSISPFLPAFPYHLGLRFIFKISFHVNCIYLFPIHQSGVLIFHEKSVFSSSHIF